MKTHCARVYEKLAVQRRVQAIEKARQSEMATLREFGETYRNPFVRIPFHFIEIGPVCVVVALVSAAILRNPRVLPARGRV